MLVGRLVDKSPTGIRLGKQSLAKIREMSTDTALEYAQFMLANMARTEAAGSAFPDPATSRLGTFRRSHGHAGAARRRQDGPVGREGWWAILDSNQ